MTSSSTTNNSNNNSSSFLFGWVFLGAAAYAVVMLAYWAWRIRMGAIDEYGPVIHEFDPWFNYRATEVRIDGVLVVYILVCGCLFT